MKNRTGIFAFIHCVAVMLVAASPQIASAQKTKPPILPPPITYQIAFMDSATRLWSLNELGVAVGSIATATENRAIVRNADGVVTDLTTAVQARDPNCPWSLLDYAFEINESGQIAGRGWRIEDGVPQARLFRYSAIDGTLEAVRIFDPSSTLFVKGMNDSGDVLLHAAVDGQDTLPSQPGQGDSVWVFSGLPGLGFGTHLLDKAVPASINNFGAIAGAIDTGTRSLAFRLTPGQTGLDYFGTINGSSSSRYQVSDGLAISDLGTLAGWACAGKTKTRDNTSQRAVRLRADGTWEDLQGSTVNSWARSINYFGDTVGFGAATGTGFIHYAGKMYSLRDLLVNAPTNLTNVYPRRITDGGQICGEVLLVKADGATFESAVILTPVH